MFISDTEGLLGLNGSCRQRVTSFHPFKHAHYVHCDHVSFPQIFQIKDKRTYLFPKQSYLYSKERKKALQSNHHRHLCIFYLLHARVYSSDVDIFMQTMPPSFGLAYDILWIFNLFNVRKLGLKSNSIFMAASKIQRNIQVPFEE